MMTYITKEQSDLVTYVHNNHDVEYRRWAEENKSELLKWYEENEYDKLPIFEALMKFAYYCAKKFMDWKLSNVITED